MYKNSSYVPLKALWDVATNMNSCFPVEETEIECKLVGGGTGIKTQEVLSPESMPITMDSFSACPLPFCGRCMYKH